MKRLIAIGVALLMVLGLSALSYAEDEPDPITTSKHIDVTLDVTEVFGMQIYPEEYDQTIYPMSETVEDRLGEIHMYVSANKGIPWAIKAESEGCTSLEFPFDPEKVAPLSITTFETDEFPLEGQTTPDLGDDPLQLTASPEPIYLSGAGEETVEGLLVHGLFHVTEDYRLQLIPGKYAGYIDLTLTQQ